MQATLPIYVHILSQVNCRTWLQGIKVVQLLKLTQAYTPTNIHNLSTSPFKRSTTYHHQSLIHSHTESKSNHHKKIHKSHTKSKIPNPRKGDPRTQQAMILETTSTWGRDQHKHDSNTQLSTPIKRQIRLH